MKKFLNCTLLFLKLIGIILLYPIKKFKIITYKIKCDFSKRVRKRLKEMGYVTIDD